MNRNGPVFPDGMSTDAFLRDYWQKKPLLVRNAFPDWQNIVEPDLLASLSMDEAAESRLVLERDGERPWELRHGPFDEATFNALPESHWTLLVQDTDKFLHALEDLLEDFRFLPDWRIDDIMVSYAAPGGSVGPHTDAYDVFLIQGFGKRSWKVQQTGVDEDLLLKDVDLKILEQFDAEDEWVLEPGDMLYLPPHIAHLGVAVDPCMTYSVGFRAPSATELWGDFLQNVEEYPELDPHYQEKSASPVVNPGEITQQTISELRDLMTQSLKMDDRLFAAWVGHYLTSTKPGFEPEPREIGDPESEVRENINRGATLVRAPGIRFAYIEINEADTRFYADATEYRLTQTAAEFVRLLANKKRFASDELKRAITNSQCQNILAMLLEDGCFEWEHAEEQ